MPWARSCWNAGHLMGRTPHERQHPIRARPDPDADHVEPPDLGGRGAGADAAAHRLQHHCARGGRSLRRRLRHQGPDAGPGGHRHARPRQLHGHRRTALPRPLPQRGDARGRCLHHQRSVAHLRPPARPHRGDSGVPRGTDYRLLRLHRPRGGHRRARLRAGCAFGVRGRALHPDHAARAARAASTRTCWRWCAGTCASRSSSKAMCTR